MNDPNGLVWHEGIFHLFYQCNPSGDTWGNMSWGHATSRDLMHWTELPIALPFTADEQIYSGSAVVDPGTSGLAGEGVEALVAMYTSAYSSGIQAQSLAWSTDGGSTWQFYARNPVLDRGSPNFRDPKVFWHAHTQRWICVAVEATDHTVLFHTSSNLIDWEPTGQFGPAQHADGLWECPDLFPLSDPETGQEAWVLTVSLNPGGVAGGSGQQYFVGHFDGRSFTPLAESVDPALRWVDYGPDFYAGVTWSRTPDDRRIMVGWMSNWAYAKTVPTRPWRGAMSLPRELTLKRTESGHTQLASRPVEYRAGTWVPLQYSDMWSPGGFPAFASSQRLQPTSLIEIREDAPGVSWELTIATTDGVSARLVADAAHGEVRLERAPRSRGLRSEMVATTFAAPLSVPHRGRIWHAFIDSVTLEVFGDDGMISFACMLDDDPTDRTVSFLGKHASATVRVPSGATHEN